MTLLVKENLKQHNDYLIGLSVPFQACVHYEQRALVVLAFLCEVVGRAVRVGGWCRAADWAARHVAQCATPWAIRHGGWVS